MNSFLDKTGLAYFWQHILAKLGGKVDKVDGKGLSTNDFTDEYKRNLDALIAALMDEDGNIHNLFIPSDPEE